MKTRVLILPALFILGVLFRLWFIGLVPQPQFIFDQEQYLGYALGILKYGLHADAYRLYGYPILIAPFIFVFGREATFPWQLAQAILDAGTGILVYILAKKWFSSSKLPILASFLYMINPLTSAYVGVMLSEVSAIFLLTLIVLLFSTYVEGKKEKVSYFLVFLLGFLPQVRPSFFVITLVLFIWLVVRSRKALLILIYMLPFLYTVLGNLYRFNQVAIGGVDNAMVREIYTSLYVEREIPNEQSIYYEYPPEAYAIWSEYSTPTTREARAAMAGKYWQLAISHIERDPGEFISSRLRKMGYIWEKHYLFPYRVETGAVSIVYWSNFLILTLGIYGFLSWTRLKKHAHMGILIGYLFVAMTLLHGISTAAERFTLPLYPLVILFAGLGLVSLLQYRMHGSDPLHH